MVSEQAAGVRKVGVGAMKELSTVGGLWVSFGGENSAKSLEMWWPGTELNRRRQPFQT